MATPTDLTRYNDITLRSTELMLEDIYDRAPDWEQRPDGERADLTYEWEGMVGRLEGAVEDDRNGLLTSEQQQRLIELARRIVRSREIITRMGLDYPDLSHVLVAMPMTAEERVDHDLASLHRWAGRLRSIAELWETPLLDVRERQAFPLEWGNVVGRLAKVEALASQGTLRPAARAELRNVAEELVELLPTMQRLRLRQPDPDVLERARRVEAA
jgi:hypothetical protein